ncbi:hypothetical protein [Vibrio paucivorans]
MASIVGLAFQLYQHKEKPLTYALLSVALVTSIVSGVLWAESRSLDIENQKLKAARYQAEMLYTSWPDPDDFNFVSGGEFRGIVLSGMAFLEANRELFPETYETTKHLMFTELKASTDDEPNYVAKRSKLQEAAEAMVLTIKTIRVPPSS